MESFYAIVLTQQSLLQAKTKVCLKCAHRMVFDEVCTTTDLFSLGLGEDLAVHDGCRGDAPCHRVNLEQATHA